MHFIDIKSLEDFQRHFGNGDKFALHIQLDADKYPKGHRLLGNTLRVGSVTEEGYWLRRDENVCIPFNKALLMQALRPKLDAASVTVTLAKNAHVLLANPPALEGPVKVREVHVVDGVPKVILELPEVTDKDGRPVRNQYPAAVFQWYFKPLEFDVEFYSKKFGADVGRNIEQKGDYYKQSFVKGIDPNHCIVHVECCLPHNKGKAGFGVLKLHSEGSTFLQNKVGHFSSVEDAEKFFAECGGV